jgi:colanic acid/amylovoran biosynthesis glycosyltransferase
MAGHVQYSGPRLSFVARVIGETSETWMWRQIRGLKRLQTDVLTWEYKQRELFPLPDTPVHILPPGSVWPEERPRFIRYLHRLRNMPRLNFYAATRRDYDVLEECVAKVQPDLMLCQYGHTGLRMLPVALRLGIPLVVHFHGSDLAPQGLVNPWYRWSLMHALSQFAAAVVVNTKQRAWLMAHGMEPGRIHVIPCGVPTEELVCSPPSRTDRDHIQFVAIGRLVDIKGVDFTIHAFANIVRIFPEARLVIIGDGPDRARLENLKQELGLDSVVCFKGWLASDQVRRSLRESDIFVQHSLVPEGWPVSVAEASAAGLPVVVTRCGGLEDQVVDGVTGYLVQQRDTASMADRMLRLAQNADLRNRMGAAGRERMVNKFDLKRQIRKLEEALIGATALHS